MMWTLIKRILHAMRGREIAPEEKDTFERNALRGTSELTLHVTATITIRYRDGGGLTTTRTITTKRIETYADGEWTLDGFCHLRKGNRTFLLSRVLTAANAETGEVIEDLRRYLSDMHAQLPETRARAAIDALEEPLSVLVNLARSDGQLRKSEKSAIADFILSHPNHANLDRDALISGINDIFCSDYHYVRIANRLGAAPEAERMALWEAAAKVAKAQKNANPIRDMKLADIKKRLKILDTISPTIE